MKILLLLVVFSILLLVPVGAQNAFAAQVQTTAQKDTFMNSIGTTTNFGNTPIMSVFLSATSEERTLVSFDLSSIPAGSTVTSVEVEMVSLGLTAVNPIVTLHKVSNNWGEFEASWNNRLLLPITPWGTAGGDFVSTPSASKTVTTTGPNTFGSTAGMVQDVQGWVDSPSTNFGWLLKTNTVPSASVFSTKENTNSPGAIITVTFTPPGGQQIGGEIIPIDATALLLSSTQSFSWMIPVLLSGIGIGLFVIRKSENP